MNSTSWLLFLVLVQLSCFHCYSATHHHHGRKHARPVLTAPATATVVGSVVIVHSSSSESATAVSGTLVGVRCHDGNGRPVIRKDVVTDRSGKFHVHLAQHEPSSSSQKLRSITSCSVAVHLPQAPPCVATTTSSARGLHLIAHHKHHHHHGGGGGARVFSAGAFAVRPELCSQKGLFFPPLPLVPEPPNIGGVPIPPNPVTPAPPSLVPPLLPAPPPPSVLPPLVPQPPPSSIIPPLLPPLVNPPPPPPPPRLLPPVPVPLLPPGFPGVPPASASKNRRPAGNP
ncbi:proline-rich protein 4-like isoform X2 [Miscanthus floridulus]|uniref:proline-rich protein 4-like isoform X2 n=1 Tax=Miscanthus floridulus TaxID=154761 RepID=UPI00345A107A